jgi:hypothetical protein
MCTGISTKFYTPGEKMLRQSSIVLFAVFMLLAAVAAYASDVVYPGGGVLAQVADGGGAQTTITLVNVDTQAAPYTLKFYDNNGNPLTLSTTAGPPSSVLTGTLNPNASVIIKTSGTSSPQVQGWGLLLTNTATDTNGLEHAMIAGTAVFSLALPANPVADATVPLDTGYDSVFALPFDHTTAVTGVAIANTYQRTPLSIQVTVYDLNGTTILTDTLQLPGYGHTSFLLTDKYQQLANRQGLIVFTPTVTDMQNNPNGYVNGLGLRANLAQTSLSTVTPIIPCYYFPSTGCKN